MENGAAAEKEENVGKAATNSARFALPCGQCGKPRCVYSEATLKGNVIATATRERLEEDNLFYCSAPLLPSDDPMFKTLFVKTDLRCRSPVETTYYLRKLGPLVCGNCGAAEDVLVDVPESWKELWGVVAPQCDSCSKAFLDPSHSKAKPNQLKAAEAALATLATKRKALSRPRATAAVAAVADAAAAAPAAV